MYTLGDAQLVYTLLYTVPGLHPAARHQHSMYAGLRAVSREEALGSSLPARAGQERLCAEVHPFFSETEGDSAQSCRCLATSS